MGRWKAWALAWLLAATLSALLLQAPSARGEELLVNGGFEDELGDEWTVTSSGDSLKREERPELVHGRSYAGRLACHDPGKCVLQQVVDDVGYGQEYELKAYVLWNDSEVLRLSIRLQWFDEHGNETGLADAEHPCTVPADEPYWCLTTGLYRAPAVARSAKLRVVVVLKVGEGVESTVAYLDDFSLTGPPTPTPSPTPPQTPSPTPSPPPSPEPTAPPMPSPEPTAPPMPSPVASPSPTAVPTATGVPSAATPSPFTPTPAAGLVNAGFEEADAEGRPLGWQKYGGELRRSAVARRQGQYAAAFTSRTASTKWAFQTVAVEGGETYVLSGYALKNDANMEAAYLRLSWYASPDGNGRVIDSVDSTTRLTDDSPDFRLLSSGPVVAPAEAASAKVRLMLEPLSEAKGTVYFDDISFGETTMPPQPVETPQPSPPPASRQSPTASAVVPDPPVEELEPSSSPDALPPRPSPAALGATLVAPQATASSRDEPSHSELGPEGRPTRTPVVLYRERRTAQSSQGGEGLTGKGDEGNGLSPILLVLAMAPPAAAAAAAAFFVRQRWKKRARPP